MGGVPKGFLPMLAPSKYATPRFPCLASRKLDGYRAIVFGGVVYSRNLKPIANAAVQAIFGLPEFEGLDGELIVGAPNDPETFRRTSSAVSRRDGVPQVSFFVFDKYLPGLPFKTRLKLAHAHCAGVLRPVEHVLIRNEEELQAFETQCLEEGYEGAMVRDPEGPYRHDRATCKEGWLIKVKCFLDTEAEVIGYEEEMLNTNEAKISENGKPKRSSHKAGKVGKGTLGALLCRGLPSKPFEGIEIHIGSGFSKAERQALWEDRESLVGKLAKFKYFPLGGKDGPRFPVFLGFRDPADA